MKRFFALPLLFRLGISLWVVLIVAVSIRVAIEKPTSQSVVPIYRAAGERWLLGADLYGSVVHKDVFRNPPIVAAAFAHPARLPTGVLAVGLRLGSILLFLWGMARVRREFVPEWSLNRIGAWLCLSSILVVPSFNNGQLNVLIAAAAMLAVTAAKAERPREAALWAALLAAIKVYPIAVGLLLVLVIPKRFAVPFFAATLLLFGLPFLIDDADYALRCCEQFVHCSVGDCRIYASPGRVPRDWTALSRMFLHVVPSPNSTNAISVLAAAACAGLVLRFRRSPEVFALVWGLGTVWMTAFGPATEMSTYSLAAAFAPFAALRAVGRGPRVLAWCGTALLTATVLRGMFPNDRDFNLFGPQAAGMLLLLPAIVNQCVQDGSLGATKPTSILEARLRRSRVSVLTAEPYPFEA